MADTNHGSIEFMKFPNPTYPGDKSKMIKKWLRDSWARRKIVALQNQVATLQSQMTILRGDCAALDAKVRALEDALAESNQT